MTVISSKKADSRRTVLPLRDASTTSTMTGVICADACTTHKQQYWRHRSKLCMFASHIEASVAERTVCRATLCSAVAAVRPAASEIKITAPTLLCTVIPRRSSIEPSSEADRVLLRAETRLLTVFICKVPGIVRSPLTYCTDAPCSSVLAIYCNDVKAKARSFS